MEGCRVHPQAQQRSGSERITRLGVYHDVLRRLRDAAAPEALAPDFADRLWAHFHRFSVSVHPEPIFGSSQNLKALVREASSRNLLDDGDAVLRPMHEITFASKDRPKGLTQETLQLEEVLEKEFHNYKAQISWYILR
nr:unnamed protein product [Digitaria exilis]